MAGMVRFDRCPHHSRHPGLVRGPPSRKSMVSDHAPLPAAEWTPEQVRGDGMGKATGSNQRSYAIALPPGGHREAVTEGRTCRYPNTRAKIVSTCLRW